MRDLSRDLGYPVDAIFETNSHAYTAICNYWIALSVPAQTAGLMAWELIGPDGHRRG